MFQELLSKLAAKRSTKMPVQKKPKLNMASAFRSLAVKRKIKGKAPKMQAGANTSIDNSSNEY